MSRCTAILLVYLPRLGANDGDLWEINWVWYTNICESVLWDDGVSSSDISLSDNTHLEFINDSNNLMIHLYFVRLRRWDGCISQRGEQERIDNKI